MAVNLQAVIDAPIIEIDTIDSTNNYAMRLIDADTALQGLTIIAKEQTEGRGQRGRQWLDEPGKSLLMSIICTPQHSLPQQFAFNAAITVAIATYLQNLSENWTVKIKWPNDIIINDKKAGGLLIENILRGANWSFSIIGFGLNVSQEKVSKDLPNATSLAIEANKSFKIEEVAKGIRSEILRAIYAPVNTTEALKSYNDYLYKVDVIQSFTNGQEEWLALIKGVTENGQLMVQLPEGNVIGYTHGMVNWNWQNEAK